MGSHVLFRIQLGLWVILIVEFPRSSMLRRLTALPLLSRGIRRSAWLTKRLGMFCTASGRALASLFRAGTSDSLPSAYNQRALCPKSKAFALSTLIEAFIITGLCRVSPDLLGALVRRKRRTNKKRNSAKFCEAFLGQNLASWQRIRAAATQSHGSTLGASQSWGTAGEWKRRAPPEELESQQLLQAAKAGSCTVAVWFFFPLLAQRLSGVMTGLH